MKASREDEAQECTASDCQFIAGTDGLCRDHRKQRARERGETPEMKAYIAKVVAEAPPLTPEQRDRLAGLLNTKARR